MCISLKECKQGGTNKRDGFKRKKVGLDAMPQTAYSSRYKKKEATVSLTWAR